jgi:hypothetical protein
MVRGKIGVAVVLEKEISIDPQEVEWRVLVVSVLMLGEEVSERETVIVSCEVRTWRGAQRT